MLELEQLYDEIRKIQKEISNYKTTNQWYWRTLAQLSFDRITIIRNQLVKDGYDIPCVREIIPGIESWVYN